MKDQYKILGEKQKVELEVEKTVAEQLREMEGFTKIPASEIANIALKRFISQHKDFFPPQKK